MVCMCMRIESFTVYADRFRIDQNQPILPPKLMDISPNILDDLMKIFKRTFSVQGQLRDSTITYEYPVKSYMKGNLLFHNYDETLLFSTLIKHCNSENDLL